MIVDAYVDGSSTGGRGPGGWGVVFFSPDLMVEAEYAGGERNTTNQRMEITALLMAIRLAPEGSRLRVFSDSAYVVNTLRQGYFKKWRDNGWINAQKEPVANRDLWEAVLQERRRLAGLDVRKVTGHALSGKHKIGNDRADMMAVAAKKEVEKGG